MPELEAEQRDAADLADYLRILRERFWVVLLTLLVILGASLAVSLTATPQYRTSARLLHRDNNFDQALFGAQIFTSTNQDREVQTGAVLVKLEPLAEAVKSRLATTLSTNDLLDMVVVNPESTTNVIDIQAISSNPVFASDVANAFAEEFVSFRQSDERATVVAARESLKEQLDTLSYAETQSDYGLMLREKYESLRILESMQDGGFTIVQRAIVPSEPFPPKWCATRSSP